MRSISVRDEAVRAAKLAAYGSVDPALDGAFDRLVFVGAHLFHVPICLIALVGTDRQRFIARVGIEFDATSRAQSFCTHTIGGDGFLEVGDARADPRFADNDYVVGLPYIRFYAGAALVDRDGAALGAFCVIDRRARQLGELGRRQLHQLANEAMQLLESRVEKSPEPVPH